MNILSDIRLFRYQNILKHQFLVVFACIKLPSHFLEGYMKYAKALRQHDRSSGTRFDTKAFRI
jgi:hypothetical protein